MKSGDAKKSRNWAEVSFSGTIHVDSFGSGVVLSGLVNEPHPDELLATGSYIAEIRVLRWPRQPEDVPLEVLKAARPIFNSFEGLAFWLNQQAKWTPGEVTPAKLLRGGKVDEVVGALLGLANRNSL